MDNLKCSGTEEKVLDCGYVTTVGADTHAEDVGVKCLVVTTEGNATNFTGKLILLVMMFGVVI